MKTNEAPEKLYLHPTAKGEVGANWLTFKLTNDDVKYTRTDAFIDKACEWLKCQDEMIGISFTEDFILRFKNYMRGE